MNLAEHRATLEAVAYGDDPGVRPTDRLKALELLAQLDAEADGDGWRNRRPVPEHEHDLIAAIDSNLAAYVLAMAYGQDVALDLPETATALGEFRKRASEAAVSAGGPSDESADSQSEPSDTSAETRAEGAPAAAPPGLTPEDLARSWPRRRSRAVSLGRL